MHSRQRPRPARPSRVAALGGRVYEHQLPRSLAGGKEKDVAAAAVWRPNSLIYYPSSLCVSPRCGGRADGGLSLFAKSTCNFRMFSRRPSATFFLFLPFLCLFRPFCLPPKEIQWPEHHSRSLARYPLRPVCFFVPLRFAKGAPVKLPVVPTTTRCAGVFLRVELESMDL